MKTKKILSALLIACVPLAMTGTAKMKNENEANRTPATTQSATRSTTGSNFLPAVIPASAKATDIAKYVNYPVGYNTGTVNITIPLHTIKVGSLELPLSLSYHSSGLKINENDGLIGLGWTLNAEPVVSRAIKGKPDEIGYLVNNKLFSHQESDSRLVAEGILDAQPDEFCYQLLNKQGNFYFSKNEQNQTSIITGPFEPVKIGYHIEQENLDKISVIDENGVYYQFDQTETSQQMYGQINGNTGWKVSQIISGDKKDTLRFTYTSGQEYIYSNTDHITVEDKITGYGTSHSMIGEWAQAPVVKYFNEGQYAQYYLIDRTNNNALKAPDNFNGQTEYVDYGWTRIYTKRLSTIQFRGGHIEFGLAQNRLSEIRIYTNQHGATPIRTISFARSLFGYAGPYSYGLDNYRYKLDNVQIKNNTSTAEEKYTFEYTTGYVPDYQRTRTFDHWGYYNGHTLNYGESAVPRMTVEGQPENSMYGFNFEIGHANKEPDEEAMKTGMLKKITYPTGRVSTFFFEAHKFRDGLYDEPKIAGGLRIRDIQEYDPVNQTSIYRVFKYGSNASGCGARYYRPQLSDYVSEQTLYDVGKVAWMRVRTYTSHPLSDAFFSGGAPITYDEVREYTSQHAGDETPVNYSDGTGWTLYKYMPFGTSVTRIGNTPNYVNNASIIGQTPLLKTENYNAAGQLVGSTEYQYDSREMGKAHGAVQYYSELPVNVSDEHKYLYGSLTGIGGTFITTSIFKIKSEKNIEKNPDGDLVTNHTYEYDYDSDTKTGDYQLMAETKTGSHGETIKKSYTYPKDYAASIYTQMIDQHRIYNVIEETEANGSTLLNRIRRNYYTLDGRILPRFTESMNNGNWQTEITFDLYDEYGNIRQITRNDGVKITYLWGYQGTCPVAEIVNAGFNDVAPLLGIAVDAIAQQTEPTVSDFALLNGLRDKPTLKSAQVSIFSYQPQVGITSETTPDKIKREYIYDTFGRLSKIRIHQNGTVCDEEQYQYNYLNR